LEGVSFVFRKLTAEEQLRMERARNLEFLNRQTEIEKIILEQLVDIDFRQSLMELGVEI
jgi:hypothetical protein